MSWNFFLFPYNIFPIFKWNVRVSQVCAASHPCSMFFNFHAISAERRTRCQNVSSEPFHFTMQWWSTYIPTEAGIGNLQECENKELQLCGMREQWICPEIVALQEPRACSNHNWSAWTKGQHSQGKEKGSQEQQGYASDDFSQNQLEAQSLIKSGPFSYSVMFGLCTKISWLNH